MVKTNIFIENIYSDFKINNLVLDEKKILTGTKKILKYFLETEEVLKNSCLKDYDYKLLSFDIVFCDNEKIHEINREYREKDRPTDVITFALFADAPKEEQFVFDNEIHLGEMMISLDKIEEQAKENNVTFDDEIHYIIAHGILHLLGFDHLTEGDYNYMVEIQNRAKAI